MCVTTLKLQVLRKALDFLSLSRLTFLCDFFFYSECMFITIVKYTQKVIMETVDFNSTFSHDTSIKKFNGIMYVIFKWIQPKLFLKFCKHTWNILKYEIHLRTFKVLYYVIVRNYYWLVKTADTYVILNSLHTIYWKCITYITMYMTTGNGNTCFRDKNWTICFGCICWNKYSVFFESVNNGFSYADQYKCRWISSSSVISRRAERKFKDYIDTHPKVHQMSKHITLSQKKLARKEKWTMYAVTEIEYKIKYFMWG